MSQRRVDHIIIVCIISSVGLFVGNTIGGLFAGLPFMIIAGVLCHRHIEFFSSEARSPKGRKGRP